MSTDTTERDEREAALRATTTSTPSGQTWGVLAEGHALAAGAAPTSTTSTTSTTLAPSDATPRERLEHVGQALLDVIAPDWRSNPHMHATPSRWAKWWDEFTNYDAGNTSTTFPVEHVDQMVVVRGIDTWSLCAHHLLPFSARVSIGYIASEQVLGLSKFARIAHKCAHRPTSQEELVASIADAVTAATGSPDVAVTASGLHLCMAMRGVRTPATMTTSVTRGLYRADQAARAEWFSIIGQGASQSLPGQ